MFLFAASMVMFACSESDDSIPLNPEKGSIVFDISAVSELNTQTRGPVYSQEATNHVTDVSVYAFKNDGTGSYKYVKTFVIPGWSDNTTFKRYEVPEGDKVPVGDYKFLGVGRNTQDMFTVTTPIVATTTFESMTASVAATGNETEIFAGFNAAMVTSEGGTRVNIPMTRKVAGILGYFKNIPQTLNGQTVKFLRLSVSNSDLAVNLTTNTSLNPTNASFNIINIDLSTQPVNNGIFSGIDLSSVGVATVPLSQLGGAYLLPVSGVTMTLGLYDTAGTAIKTWTVKDGAASNMNIIANHFYSLGTKKMAGNTTGGTGDPGDDDNPIDLLTDQNIVITIDPAWNTLHDLVVVPVAP